MDKNQYPLTDFRFLLIIDDIAVAGFSEVSGLEKTIDTEDYKEGGNDFVHKLPAGITYSNLTLKRGLSDSNQLWKWHLDVTNALSNGIALKNLRKNITLVILDEERKATQWLFTFKDAYPAKWTGPGFNAMGNSVVIEILEIVHRGFERS